MSNFQGFAPYIQMFDSEKLKPGQTIVVEGSDYTVLPLDSNDKHPVYRVMGRFKRTRNVRNLLKKKEWYIKGASPE